MQKICIRCKPDGFVKYQATVINLSRKYYYRILANY